MWPESFLAPPAIQALRIVLRERKEGVRTRTRTGNRINNIVLRFGHTFATSGPILAGIGRPIVEAMIEGRLPNARGVSPHVLPPPVRKTLERLLTTVDRAEETIKWADTALKEAVKASVFNFGGQEIDGTAAVKMLCTVPGIGPLTSILWLTEVVDVFRFNSADQVVAYCGLDPSLKVSAGKVTQHVRRKGNKQLHFMLTQAAAGNIRRRREPMGQWGYRLAKRSPKAGWRRACSAVARRLAIAMFHVQRTGTDYSPVKYGAFTVPDVTKLSVKDEMAGRYATLLGVHGITDTEAMTKAYFNDLAVLDGVGKGCLNAVRQWIEKNKRR